MPALHSKRHTQLTLAAALTGTLALAGCASGAASDSLVGGPSPTASGSASLNPATAVPLPPGSPDASAPSAVSPSASASAAAKASAKASASPSAKASEIPAKKPGAVKTSGSAKNPAVTSPAATAPAKIDPRLTVSKTSGLDPAGATVTVTGSGFDTSKGIYIAFCVRPADGAVPSPCGGGADTSGSTGASQWVSSNPPPYGKNLAIPYGPGGTFTLTVAISKMIGSVDCSVTRCVVAARADHTRTSDRSQDVLIPITFRS